MLEPPETGAILVIDLSRFSLTCRIELELFLLAFIIKKELVWGRPMVVSSSGPIAYITT